jgi:regulator of protease activity HflC (stomatin/prohibitin superfamily)
MFVGLEDIHPPSKVAGVFEEIVGAAETRESRVLDARAHATVTNSTALGQSYRLLEQAEAIKHGSITNAVAQAELFTNQELAWAAAPGYQGVYEQQAYLDALVESSANARKYVIATTNAPNIPIFDLQDKIRLDILNQMSAPTNK